MPSSLKEDDAGGGDGVPERHDEPELLLAPGDTDDLPPQAPVQQNDPLILSTMISQFLKMY